MTFPAHLWYKRNIMEILGQEELEKYLYTPGQAEAPARQMMGEWVMSPVTRYLTKRFREYEQMLVNRITSVGGSVLSLEVGALVDKWLAELRAVRVFLRLHNRWEEEGKTQ